MLQKVSNTMKTILIVEDEPANAEIAEIFCQHLGHRTLLATDGVQAVRMTQTQPVDLILMDILLPIKDGLQATREIKLDPQTSHIPIIAVSARASDEQQREMRQAGVVDSIIKPYRGQDLQSSVQRWLNP